MSEEQGNNGVLTEHMIIMKTRANAVSDVKQLNMWGYQIRDISVFRKMPHVEVISLPINNIDNLEPLQYCTNLRDLHLRQNQISDFSQLAYLQGLENLQHLTLSGNPISKASNYREVVIAHLPQIRRLDDQDITESERRCAQTTGSRPVARRPQQSFVETSPPRQQPAPAPAPQTFARARTHRNDEGALTAVLALLPELSPESLSIVLQTISDLAKRQ